MKTVIERGKEEGRRKKVGLRPFSSLLLPSSRSDAIQRATFALAATDSPRLTAEALLAHVLGVSRAQLLSRPEHTLPPHLLADYEALIARAAAGEPLAYLTGHREFCGLDFLIDARVLVPRPESELLVELALKFTAELAEDANGIGRGVQLPAPGPQAQVNAPTEMNILDVGAGSGCLAVTLAVRLPSARLTALDISADALALARLNARRHGVADRITFLQSNLLSTFHLPLITPFGPQAPARRGETAFHLLVANPPYIPTAELQRLPVSRHEPALALDGGPDGLDLIRRLLADAPRVMAPGGRLLLEINDEKGAEAFDLARAARPSAQIELHKDFAGFDRALAISL